MKRIVLWFLGTVSAVVLLFGYRTSTSGPEAATPLASGNETGPGTSAPSTAPSSVPSSVPSSAPGSSTVTGDVAQTQWGPVQVQLTVQSGKITAVSVPQYPNGNRRDAEINQYALPILINETVQAQSADIDMVSGATVTSDGYIRSLQSVLDQVK
ncbi:FMN-binding protein [Kribbella jiaozuonensis]|uniref:FMN-binding protein n=1 Tax=Kribbella jiaozuonensis TaxID=2575441 RepID=A0A4U3LLG5_9ACTN|nr:FMN-binding protein [Kribbella jiaozuonensis]TKK76551.1 FMN-binding protein [Kribbella jiaozuonensis]